MKAVLFYLELNCSLHHLIFQDQRTAAQRICSKVAKWFRLLTGRSSKTRKVFLVSNKERIDRINSQRNNRISYYAFLDVDQLLYNQLKRRCADKNFERLSFSPSEGLKTLCSMHRQLSNQGFKRKESNLQGNIFFFSSFSSPRYETTRGRQLVNRTIHNTPAAC